MFSRLRRFGGSTRGTAIVEFMIIFPMLLVLGVAIWEFGRLEESLVIVTNAAREGARYAAAHSTDNSLVVDTQSFVYTNYLTTALGNRLGSKGDISITSGNITVSFTDPSGNTSTSPAPGDKVTVTVPFTAKVYTPFIPGLSGTTSLTGVATMDLQ